jgi:predicted acylesterase/phospholipase RssA
METLEETPVIIPDEKVVENISEYDTLVVSGGGAKGICALGALQYATDNFLLKNVKTFIGTSVGSMICYLLAIGYTPIEIIVYVCTHQLMEHLSQFNLVAMLNGGGATSFSNIHEQLEKMTIAKLGCLLTLGALKKKYGKTLICVVHNWTTDKTEYMGPDTHPDVPCLIACRMSSTLPFVFEKYSYMGSQYIDGGISDNFAIDVADKIGKKILGVLLVSQRDDFDTGNQEATILQDIYRMLFTPINQAIEYKLKLISNRCTVLRIATPANMKPFNFALTSHTKLEMFSDGYHSAETQLS